MIKKSENTEFCFTTKKSIHKTWTLTEGVNYWKKFRQW